MRIFAISDLHLSLSCPEKDMSVFGPNWEDYQEKIKTHWQSIVKDEDLVLIAGDISWAMRLDQACIDLEFIHSLNGSKVISKGNHDYWWSSRTKVKKILPSSIQAVHHNAIDIDNVSICATRFGDSLDFNFDSIVDVNPSQIKQQDPKEKEKIYIRELNRLEIALKELNQSAAIKIAMVHYPPISLDLKDNPATRLLEKYQVNFCVFGHLHNVKKGTYFGTKNNVHYMFTSCDYLNFTPILITT